MTEGDADRWSRVWQRHVPGDPFDAKGDPVCVLLTRMLPLVSGMSVLEVGCGSGKVTLTMAREVGLRVTLLDFSPVALDLARANAVRLGVRADFVRADARHLPFRDGQFEIVWSGGVFEHFVGEQRARVFQEAFRVCRPAGRVVVIVPNAWNALSRVGQFVSARLGRWPLGLEVPFAPPELRRALETAGVADVEVDGVDWLASYWLVKLPPARTLLTWPPIRRSNLCRSLLNRLTGRYIGACGTKP